MDSKTKIVVLHTKELIYTAVFALLCILLIVLLFRHVWSRTYRQKSKHLTKQYTPGTYTSTLTLNNTNLEVEVSVDSSGSIPSGFANLDETVTTMCFL